MRSTYNQLSIADFLKTHEPTLEAYAPEEGAVDPDLTMKISLVTDKLINDSKLPLVYDPISFMKGDIPTEGGLFSRSIFGSTAEDQKRIFARIDLHEKFFHPYVYEILKTMMPKRFEKCASGIGGWIITKDGDLKELKPEDPEYNEENSGIKWLVQNYHNMVFKPTNANVRKDRIKLLEGLSDNEIFVTKWIVVPLMYRDIDKNTSSRKLPELNNNYNNVIRYANSLKESTFDFFNNQVRYNLQKELVTIRVYAQRLLEKKHGFFHKAILGKSIDRGSRDVISVATMNYQQRPEDNPVDIIHTGIPLAKCMVIGYDFIMRYVTEYFAENFRNVREYPVYDKIDGKYEIVGSIPIKDQMLKFTPKYIEKRINRFKNSHSTRLEPITLVTESGAEIPLHLIGRNTPFGSETGTDAAIVNRPMTWTDLFYMAAVNTLSDKYVYITRYPITSHNSIFPSKCRPMSTIKTRGLYIDGTYYQYYPDFDINTPSNRVSSLFNDTVTMSNMYLAALGGDYDGDTVSLKLCYSLEANQEAAEIALAIRNFVSPDGSLLRVLGNEAYLAFYNMTRHEEKGPVLSKELKKELLALDKSSLTINSIAKLFGQTTKLDRSGKRGFNRIPPKFDIRAKMILEANEYINTSKVETTVGIFLFNKLLIEGNLTNVVPNGYYNEICNKKKFSKLTNMIASAIMNRVIDIENNTVEFINANEFWGLGLVTIFAGSFSMETIIPNKELQSLKKKMIKEAPDNDLATLVDIEERLLKEADRITKGTEGKHMFDSGARGSFGNDFKNMAISVGPVSNPITKKYDFMLSSYMEGIKKEDLVAGANTILAAEYPKAMGTAKGGYMTKQFYAVFQSIMIGEPESDCGTENGLTVTITKNNLADFVDQNIMLSNGKVLLITEDLASEYMNKPIKIRSPMYCIAEKLCSKCAGQRYYKVGIDGLGLTTPAISGVLQNKSLKLRHSLKVEIDEIDIETLLI